MLIFIDIETTGLEREDKICKYELVNEGKKIPPQASSIHHITNEMIKEKSAFKEGEIYKFLQENSNDKNTLIAHNIKFNLEKLSSAGVTWKGDLTDTLRVTKHLIPECEFFSLQVLRYELQLYRDEEKLKDELGIKDALSAHNALSDTLVVKLLFNSLEELASLDEMKELSFKNVLLQKFDFGKHSGKYIEEVAMNDRGYLEWMLHSVSDLDEDLKYSINYYLKG